MTGPRCPDCDRAAAAGARFCPSCGMRLSGQRLVRARVMSILFCDLVGSTALNERIGDEAMFALLSAYQEICEAVVDEEGGYVAKFMGDGMLAYFGYPGAMRDSAARAVSAALGIIERVRRLAVPDAAGLQVSAGVTIGRVVVGDSHAGPGAREAMAIGGTVNLAARLQAVAPVGTVVVGDEVCRALDPTLFPRSFLGVRPLKGFAAPVALWGVARGQARPAPGDFVGHAKALGALQQAWDEARAGTSCAVEVLAPGGYGKTTLVRRFLSGLDADQEVFLLRGQSHRREQSFACLKPFVAELAGIDTSAPHQAQRDWLAHFAPGPVGEGLALLLGLEAEPIAPLVRQDRILRALDGLLRTLLGGGRVVLVVEDLHWLDPETRSLLGSLPDRLAGQPVLLLATGRPEGGRLWPGTSLAVGLDRLAADEAEAMLARLDPRGRLAPTTRAGIVRRAAGVPLFLDQIARAVLERPEATDAGSLPDTLVEALLERFDRLGEGQALVEAAAVLGPAIRLDVLARMLGLGLSETSARVAGLVARGLFRQGDDGTVAFDHALIRDAVLGTILSAQRADLHARALVALEAVAPGRLVEDPGLAAHHLLGAGRPAEAIPRLVEAARRAIGLGHLGEAVAHLRQAEAALENLSPGDARDELDMVVQFFLGDALVQARGFADATVNAAYRRSLDLCLQRAEGSETEFGIVWGLWAHHMVVGGTDTAARMTGRMEAIARDLPHLAVLSECARSINAFVLGDLTAQEEAGERVARLYDPVGDRLLAVTYLMDPLELVHLFRIHGRFLGGDAAGWRVAMAESAAHEERLALPFLSPYIGVFGAAPLCYARPDPDLRPRLEAAVARAAELGQPFWMMSGGLWLAAERVRREGAAAALPDQEAAVAMARATGLGLTMSFHEALLARSQAELGRHDQAEATLDRALAAVAAGQDRIYEPEVLRQAAEVARLARPEEPARAESLLRRAATRAEALGTRAWSALIVASEARLMAASRGRAEAEAWLRGQLVALAPGEPLDHPAFQAAAEAFADPI